MINWARCRAVNTEFTLIMDKSNSGFGNRKLKLVLASERSDEYKRTKKKSKREETCSRK